MSDTRIIVFRHGNTFDVGDTVLRIGGKTDMPLSSSGRKQSRLLGEAMSADEHKPAAVFTSELSRTKDTARIMLEIINHPEIEITPQSSLNEIDYGPDEGQPESVVRERLGREALLNWDTQALVPQGWNVSVSDIKKAWQDLANMIVEKYSGKVVWVVTSQGIGRFAYSLMEKTRQTDWLKENRPRLATGSYSILEKNSDNEYWDILSWNNKASN